MANSFRCSYCNKAYARESWYRKHEHVCEKRKRFEQAHQMDFHRGIRLYTHWRVRNNYVRKGRTITPQEFIDSQYFKAFMRLVTFTSENWVITSIRYLDFLMDYRIAENRWCHEDTLKTYREHTRRFEDPINQSKITCQAISDWCKNNETDTKEFFAKIPPGQALQMVVNNQLSPWVLFGYDRSVSDLLSRMNDDWLSSINEFINNKYWINKITGCENVQRSIQAECERQLGDE
jgi:hypothetical protein